LGWYIALKNQDFKRIGEETSDEDDVIDDQNKQPQAPSFMNGVRLFIYFSRTSVPLNWH
jgi:hypothetical protein